MRERFGKQCRCDTLPPLTIRADADSEVGAGHVMRCACVADAWRDLTGRGSHFCGRIEQAFARARVESGGHRIVQDFSNPGRGVLLVDSYSPTERKKWATRGSPLLRVLLDDTGEDVPPGYDVVWNPNAYGTKSLYRAFKGLVLTGKRAVPVRTDLPRWRPMPTERLGVTLGGGPIPPSLVRALSVMAETLKPMKISAVGSWAPSGWEMLSTSAPWDSLSACTAVITSAGTTMWESAAVGVPAIIALTAENQMLAAEWAQLAGVPVCNGLHGVNTERLARMLVAAVPRAKPLPHVSSGAHYIARKLAVLAMRQAYPTDSAAFLRSPRGSGVRKGK